MATERRIPEATVARLPVYLRSLVEMGGRGIESDNTRVTEASVRGFWTFYRTQMGL